MPYYCITAKCIHCCLLVLLHFMVTLPFYKLTTNRLTVCWQTELCWLTVEIDFPMLVHVALKEFASCLTSQMNRKWTSSPRLLFMKMFLHKSHAPRLRSRNCRLSAWRSPGSHRVVPCLWPGSVWWFPERQHKGKQLIKTHTHRRLEKCSRQQCGQCCTLLFLWVM